MKFIVWRRFKWLFIGLIILLILLLFVAVLLYSLPVRIFKCHCSSAVVWSEQYTSHQQDTLLTQTRVSFNSVLAGREGLYPYSYKQPQLIFTEN